MRRWRAPVIAAALAALGVGGWMLGLAVLVGLDLDAPARARLRAGIAAQMPLLLLGWALAVVVLVAGWRRWVARPRRQLAQLGERARVLLHAEAGEVAPPAGPGALAQLAGGVQALAEQRDALRRDMQAQIAQGSRRLQDEKDRLAALLAELPQSVLVCNLDGRILLYNQQARQQLGRSAGIGRSLDGLMEATLLQHALRGVRRRLARGEASATQQFVTYTPGGQLLQAQMAPVLAGAADQPPADGPAPDAAGREITGYVLLLDDITRDFARESRREQVLTELTEGSRASLASIRAAVEMLDYDDVDADMRKRFLAVVHEETQRMAARLDEVASQAAAEVRTRWPLQNMLGSDFIAMAQHHLHERTQWQIDVAEVQPELWLRVDSYSLVQALAYLAWRLLDQFEIDALQLRLQAADHERAWLDLCWHGSTVSTETAMGWETEPMHMGEERSTLTVRDVVARHDGEIWLERDREHGNASFRFLLPLGEARQAAPASDDDAQSRPEYYDFDLFGHLEAGGALDEQPLASLRYTVFDTETTGLDPAGGDQILQIGAVRIVNARILAGDVFDQLVNPGRDIPEAGIAIHGISPQMVADQPRIPQVLPEFHRFAEDSVLVGHNAAFDMKFLQLQEQRSGVVFGQPVLDTLLLSAVVHPAQETHSLEDIAARLGLTVSGRHTALGDARLTAEIWLRLMAQLADLGIHTLRQALEAAQRTYYARLKY